MFKEFINIGKNTIIYGIPDIVAKAVGFFMIPIYTRFLTPEDYGVMAMLLLFTGFVTLILPLSINTAFMRYYFEGKTEKEKNTVYSTALLFITVLALIGVSILMIFSKQASFLLFGSIQYSFHVKLMLAACLFQMIQIIPSQLFIARQNSTIYASTQIISFIIHISLNVYLIAFLNLGLLGFLYSNLITAVLIGTFVFLLTIFQTGTKFSSYWLKPMFCYGAPLMATSIFSYLYLQMDRFLLQKFSLLSELGLYALALQFGNVLTYIIWPLSVSIGPFVLLNYKKEKSKEMFSRLFTYSFLLVLGFALALSIFIVNIFLIAVGKEFLTAYKLVPTLSLAFLINSCSFLAIGIGLEKKTKYALYVSIITLIVALVANLLLIPKLGAAGAAISKVIIFAISIFLLYKISQKLYYIHYEFKRIGLALVLAIVLYFINTFIPIEPFFASIVLRGLVLLIFPLGLFLLGFFKKDELDKLKEILSHFKHDGFRKTLNNYFLMK